MPANLSILDKFNRTPTAAVVGEPHTPTEYRAELSQLSENGVFLFNRLAKIFGDYQLVSSVSAGGDSLEIVAHGIADDTVVRVEAIGGTAPAGLSASIGYYWQTLDADNGQLSLTPGGAAVDITGTGSGTLYLYAVPDMLNNLVPRAITFAGSHTLAAVASLKSAFLFVMSVYGGTFVGPVTWTGNDAYRVDRTASLADADQSITLEQKDFRHCPDVTANRTITIAEPAAAGLTSRISRTLYANAFAAVFRRASDASIIGRLNAVGGLLLESYDSGDGKGITWHAAGMGGADQVT